MRRLFCTIAAVMLTAPRFATLADVAAATGQERHGIEVDYDIFEDLRAPSPPDSSKPGRPYEAASLDFRLKPDGPRWLQEQPFYR